MRRRIEAARRVRGLVALHQTTIKTPLPAPGARSPCLLYLFDRALVRSAPYMGRYFAAGVGGLSPACCRLFVLLHPCAMRRCFLGVRHLQAAGP
eukprot:scaffold12924_cov125-Isochrysis_galbana.AAC.2